MSVRTAPATKIKEPWRPIPGSSQEFALDTRAQQTLYHGARGPGKTDTQLMRFYRRVGIGYGPFWKGVIFDREYKNLDDIIGKSRRWFSGFSDGAVFLAASNQYKWVWPTGEELLFRVVKKTEDYWNYHGQEFPFIGWNELCKFPTYELYDMLMSCNRSSFTPEKDAANLWDTAGNKVELSRIPLEVFSTANPYGPGHSWVKERFIDPVDNGVVQRSSQLVLNPATGIEENIETTKVAIFGSWRENIYLAPQYIATLMNEKDPNLRKAWLEGDWDIVAGGAFDDVFDKRVHILKPFKIPASWRIDRSFDWGSTHPFCCIWWAEANGEEAVFPDGTKWNPPSGTLVAFAELYGSQGKGSNKGLKWGAPHVAQEIKAREAKLMLDGVIGRLPIPGPADNQIYDVSRVDVDTIAYAMELNGVYWERSDKSKGSRKNGLQLARDRFEAGKLREGPALYCTHNCTAFRTILPTLPRDPDDMDDVDTDAEDHVWDAVRYRVLKSANRIADNLTFRMPY